MTPETVTVSGWLSEIENGKAKVAAYLYLLNVVEYGPKS